MGTLSKRKVVINKHRMIKARLKRTNEKMACEQAGNSSSQMDSTQSPQMGDMLGTGIFGGIDMNILTPF